ncbi:hypothetical protein ACIHCM_10170 [Streptomyces sp. NPDC052023]|uniref:hypothetical protein n=1 Tax=Streptomyces sp. NPDC052023 TaxID=3365681 RepID=UPI0037D0A173
MLMLAILLLPGLSLLLIVMSRIEDKLHEAPRPARHARPGHLRLLRGGAAAATPASETDQRSAARSTAA